MWPTNTGSEPAHVDKGKTIPVAWPWREKNQVTAGTFEPYGESFDVGDTIHCEASWGAGYRCIGG